MGIELEQSRNSESPVLRTHTLDDGRTIVLFGSKQEGVSSWYSLQPHERLIVSAVDSETSAWFRNRTGLDLPSGDRQIFVHDTRQSTIRSVSPLTGSLDATTIVPSETLNGTLQDAREGHSSDTAKIVKQKTLAQKAITPLVAKQLARNNMAQVGEFETGKVYLVSVTDDMSEKSVIAGDPQAADADFRERKMLLKPGSLLLVRVDSQGTISYGNTTWGKVKTGEPNNLGTLTVNGRPLSDYVSHITFGLRSDQTKEIKRQSDRVTAHLIKHLIVSADYVYPADTKLPKTTKAELPRLEDLDLPSSLKQHMLHILPTLKQTEASRQQEVPIQLGSLSEDVIEAYLEKPQSQRADFLVDYVVLTTQVPREVEGLVKRAGFAALGEQAESILSQLYRKNLDFWTALSQDAIDQRILQIEDTALQQQLQKLVASSRRRGADSAVGKEIARFLSALEFDRELNERGLRYFEGVKKVDPRTLQLPVPDTFHGRTYERTERLIKAHRPYSDIIKRQLGMFLSHNPSGASTVYETPHFRELAQALRAIGHEDAAGIPWMSAESHAEISGRKQFEEFALTASLATDVARELYKNPHDFAVSLGLRPGTEQYNRVIHLSELVKATIDWNLPEFLPNPTQGGIDQQLPLMLIRPDFARRQGEDGQLEWVATELENSPGGLGMELVIMAGHPEIRSDLVSNLARYMEEAAVPEGVDRNQLTIVMTEEWQPYRTELEVFLDEFHKKTGVKTHIYSIEELAADPSKKVESGFVFHFAYTWNFMKDPSQYYLNLLLNPKHVAEALGVRVDTVVQDGYRGAQNAAKLVSARDEVLAFGDKKFRQELRLPKAHWEKGLTQYIYVPNIATMRSVNPAYQGMTLREIGSAMATRLSQTAQQLYQRQGSDVVIFNDPYMGNCVNGKYDLAVMHLPGFSDVLQQALTSTYGLNNQSAAHSVQTLQKMTAVTVPLTVSSKSPGLNEYVQQAVQQAQQNRDKWIIKVSSDPQFGAVDWGARGLIRGSEKTDAQWTQALQLALASDIPWVLQEVVDNVPFDQPRRTRSAQTIDADGRQMIALYNREPSNTNFAFGELALTSVIPRFNPFLFAYRDRRGKLRSLVSDGIITLTPYDDTQKAQAVHGSTGAAMVGVKFVD